MNNDEPINNGGPAYPTSPKVCVPIAQNDSDPTKWIYSYEGQERGLTLRDYFAGQALAGMGCQWKAIESYIKSTGGMGYASEVRQFMAYAAYAQADAMLIEREVQP